MAEIARLLTGAALLAGLLLGCGGTMSPQEKLVDAVHRYNNAVRWRNYELAATFVPVEKRDSYLSTRQGHEDDMRILDYEVEEIRQTEKNKSAAARVQFSWVRLASNVVAKTHFLQTWHYGENKQWTLGSQEKLAPARPPDKTVPLTDRF